MTSKTQHTPGPWSYADEAYDGNYEISDDAGTTLAQVEAWDAGDEDLTGEIPAQALANARLITAAPEMREQLEKDAARFRRIRESLIAIAAYEGNRKAELVGYIEQCEAETKSAIAKATGQAA